MNGNATPIGIQLNGRAGKITEVLPSNGTYLLPFHASVDASVIANVGIIANVTADIIAGVDVDVDAIDSKGMPRQKKEEEIRT